VKFYVSALVGVIIKVILRNASSNNKDFFKYFLSVQEMGFRITILYFINILIFHYLTALLSCLSLYDVIDNELEILYKDPVVTLFELLSGKFP